MLNFFDSVSRAYYALFYPWNRIKVRNLSRFYTCDRDYLLFHTNFSILCDFIEKQKPKFPQSKDGYGDNWYEVGQVFNGLYKWYTSIDWKDPVPRLSNDKDREWGERLDEFDEKCKENLILLAKWSPYMWT